MSSNLRGRLTRYEEGSVQELWAISFPLILSMLSINIMLFVDRLMLAKYDTRSMNAAVVAGLMFSIFQYGTVGIAAISEIFVGQFNGAKKKEVIGEAIWQMIWFSLFTALFFVPVGLLAGPLLLPNPEYIKEGLPFFKWMMMFGPAFPMVAALSSFFVGRGQVNLVMVTTILSNILNISLNFILIFGVEGLLSPLGACGAAIATGVSQTIHVLVLLVLFLTKKYRIEFGTGKWIFNFKLFCKMFALGLPTAFSSIVELSAWCILAQILSSVSEAHITVFSIGDSAFTLFAFGFWGLQKGITAVVANYLGAERKEMISLCLHSGLKIILGIMLVLALPLLFFPEILVNQFLSSEPIASSSFTEMSVVSSDWAYSITALRWLWLYFLLDAIAWLISGVLTAAGDTKFVLILNILSAWIFSSLPTYIGVVCLGGSPLLTWILCAFYGALNTLSFYARYRLKNWNTKLPLQAYT